MKIDLTEEEIHFILKCIEMSSAEGFYRLEHMREDAMKVGVSLLVKLGYSIDGAISFIDDIL